MCSGDHIWTNNWKISKIKTISHFNSELSSLVRFVNFRMLFDYLFLLNCYRWKMDNLVSIFQRNKIAQ